MTENVKHILESELGVPFTQGNKIDILKNGDEIFKSMLNGIDKAEHTIDFLTFVYWSGNIAKEFADALSEKAKSGIRVRVLLDSFGASDIPDELVDKMKASGIDIRWFRPLKSWRFWTIDNRTHRKVLIIDKAVGFTGGVGIAKEWEGNANNPSEWRDTHFKVVGNAVHGLQAAFSSNWAETKRSQINSLTKEAADIPEDIDENVLIQIVRSTASIGWSDIATLLELLITLANNRISISSAYFVPNQTITDCLIDAAERNVKVDIMFPGQYTDQRVSQLAGQNEFSKLLNAGINLWAYQKTMLHTKILLVDDNVICVGSANFNQRSMRKDDEVAMTIIDNHCAEVLYAHFKEDLTDCDKVTYDYWKKRSALKRLAEKLTLPFKPQL